MFAYRILSAIDQSYGVALFWVYIAAFALAFMMVFVFPPGAIALLFLSLFSLLILIPLSRGLHAIVRLIGRRHLRHGRCPTCGQQVGPMNTDEARNEAWSCHDCGARFMGSGEWIDPRMIADVPG